MAWETLSRGAGGKRAVSYRQFGIVECACNNRQPVHVTVAAVAHRRVFVRRQFHLTSVSRASFDLGEQLDGAPCELQIPALVPQFHGCVMVAFVEVVVDYAVDCSLVRNNWTSCAARVTPCTVRALGPRTAEGDAK